MFVRMYYACACIMSFTSFVCVCCACILIFLDLFINKLYKKRKMVLELIIGKNEFNSEISYMHSLLIYMPWKIKKKKNEGKIFRIDFEEEGTACRMRP